MVSGKKQDQEQEEHMSNCQPEFWQIRPKIPDRRPAIVGFSRQNLSFLSERMMFGLTMIKLSKHMVKF